MISLSTFRYLAFSHYVYKYNNSSINYIDYIIGNVKGAYTRLRDLLP